MSKRTLLLVLTMSIVVSGCSVSGFTTRMQAIRHMESGNYREAAELFTDKVRQNPRDSFAQYYLGRFLLAQGRAEAALEHLQKAAQLAPQNADMNFWLGVAYGETSRSQLERAQYEKVLRLSRHHSQARLYLGHWHMRNGNYQAALDDYEEVLEDIPTNPAALYNTALIHHIKGDREKARKGWLEYLKWFPAGRHAIWAADHLNELGDFSYENHYLGSRTVTLKEISFRDQSNEISIESYSSLRLVGRIVHNMPDTILQIVVYETDQQVSPALRARAVRDKILELTPGLAPGRIRISWFKEPDIIIKDGRKYRKNSSVRLFLTE